MGRHKRRPKKKGRPKKEDHHVEGRESKEDSPSTKATTAEGDETSNEKQSGEASCKGEDHSSASVEGVTGVLAEEGGKGIRAQQKKGEDVPEKEARALSMGLIHESQPAGIGRGRGRARALSMGLIHESQPAGIGRGRGRARALSKGLIHESQPAGIGRGRGRAGKIGKGYTESNKPRRGSVKNGRLKKGDAENALNTNSQPAPKKPKWQIEKEEYLKMPIFEKRSIYKAEYVTLDSVPTWPEYYKKISKELKGKSSKVPVDEELNSKVSLWCGDITTLEIDCIVNAANESMLGGSGVDGAIHNAAGPTLLAECRTVHGCKTGDAKITGGYKLPAKYIIHTVGPRYHGDEKLRNCYKKSLDLMIENNLRSIAFPCISTGIYGFPGERAADIAVTTVRDFLQNHRDKVDRVIFCLFTRQDIYIYESTMQTYFPVEGKHRDYEDQMSDDHPNANPRGKPSDKSSVPKL